MSAAGSISFSQQQINTRVDKLKRTINQLNSRHDELETLVGNQMAWSRLIHTIIIRLLEDDTELEDNSR
jgi:hypothetical protein